MIRQAVLRELDLIVAMRVAMWNELNPQSPSDADFESRIRAFYADAFATSSSLVWVAEEAGEIVGMVTLLVHQHPPRRDDPELRGYVTAMYVAPCARLRGHARALIDAVLAHARARKMRRLLLRTTDAARHLYRAAGFAPTEHLSIDLT